LDTENTITTPNTPEGGVSRCLPNICGIKNIRQETNNHQNKYSIKVNEHKYFGDEEETLQQGKKPL
jgi:hypothetical protein